MGGTRDIVLGSLGFFLGGSTAGTSAVGEGARYRYQRRANVRA